MGNCLGCRCVEDDSDIEQYYHSYHSGYGGGAQGGASCPRPSGGFTYGGGAQGGASRPLPNGGVVITTYPVVGYKAVAHDLVEFKYTNKLPSKLGDYVLASKDTQRYWYAKLLRAWKRANPHPTSDEAVVALIIETLQGHDDIQGLLRFYRLPCPAAPTIRHVPDVSKFEEEEFEEEDDGPTWSPVLTLQDVSEVTESEEEEEFEEEDDGPTWPPILTLQDVSEVTESEEEEEEEDDHGLAWPRGVTYKIHTLPVQEEKIGDGDGFTAFVDVDEDARETANLPLEIKNAVKQRRIARIEKNFSKADALRKKIEEGGYRVCDGKKGRLLRKYKIRLRGVDAPEIGQPYGEEAKVVLRKLIKGQELLIHVYDTDKYKRQVGDVYCNDVFIQVLILTTPKNTQEFMV